MVALAATAQALGGDAKDLKNLQGEWVLVEVDGKKVDKEFQIVATVTNTRLTLANPGEKQKSHTIRLDAAKNPKHIDLLPPDPKNKKGVADQIGKTKVDTILGPLDWTSGGSANPVKNVATIPMVGTQWVQKGDKFDLEVVSNKLVPALPVAGPLEPLT